MGRRKRKDARGVRGYCMGLFKLSFTLYASYLDFLPLSGIIPAIFRSDMSSVAMKSFVTSFISLAVSSSIDALLRSRSSAS